jgi:hypothetical protein
MEPAAGAGGMVIAAALLDGGTHYRPIMRATLLDTDATASHMAYVQLSHPAYPSHCDPRQCTEARHNLGPWVTLAHVMGRSDTRLSAS